MLTNFDPPTEEKRCRHRWEFVCWWDDPTPRKNDQHDLRYLIEGCKRCPTARIVWYIDGKRTRCVGYADSVKEAVLGTDEPLRIEVGVN